MRFGVRTVFCSLACLSSFAVVGSACIPDPKGDFDTFIDRTNGLGSGNDGDASTFDSKPPETATEALYAGICVTTLAARDPAQALRFYTETKFTPTAGGAGTITMTLTPLRGWDTAKNDFVNPSSVAKSETRGAPFGAQSVPVAADGRFTANLGTINLAGEANSISGREAVIENVVLDGRFGTERFCSTLGGQLTVPYSFTFDPAQNTCLFVKVVDGAPLPALQSTEFSCAL